MGKTDWKAKCVCGHSRIVHTDDGPCAAVLTKPDRSSRTGFSADGPCPCTAFRPKRLNGLFACTDPLGMYESQEM